MMNELLYPMIFKRKSFHIFKNTGSIQTEELEQIRQTCRNLKPLISDIRTEFRIVKENETTCKRGAEYCILLYSENKPGYLPNIGYMGEQLDLYLASMNIGALWFGIGKVPETQHDGLDFVIMIAIAKMPEDKFRKDMFKSKRKPLKEIWVGNDYPDIGNIVRFTPSACNTQPWIVETGGQELNVYRYKKSGKRGIMPAAKVAYYNRIDIGIFLLFLELCLEQDGIRYERVLYADLSDDDQEKTLAAKYKIERTGENA